MLEWNKRKEGEEEAETLLRIKPLLNKNVVF